MGNIEKSIMENYKKALREGNLSQAKKAVELAGTLKAMIENQSFLDFDSAPRTQSVIIGNVFKPFSYKYFEDSGIVVIMGSTINLTDTENRFFNLLSLNETNGAEINIIRRDQIKHMVWPENAVTDNAVRILVRRLRHKIEPDPLAPQIILNYNKKGYVFVAKREA